MSVLSLEQFMTTPPEQMPYDIIIVGAGSAGQCWQHVLAKMSRHVLFCCWNRPVI